MSQTIHRISPQTLSTLQGVVSGQLSRRILPEGIEVDNRSRDRAHRVPRVDTTKSKDVPSCRDIRRCAASHLMILHDEHELLLMRLNGCYVSHRTNFGLASARRTRDATQGNESEPTRVKPRQCLRCGCGVGVATWPSTLSTTVWCPFR